VRIGVVQADPQLGDVEGNLRRCIERLEEAAAGGCALVVFPECALSGYMFDDVVDAIRAAVGVPGPEIDALLAACARLDLERCRVSAPPKVRSTAMTMLGSPPRTSRFQPSRNG